ncbi:MAG: flippase-like domain-containing protein [Solirubrobacterales bacterium]|nr:flippase-like domain-containing protein [Solirubrobacterales bacterium]
MTRSVSSDQHREDRERDELRDPSSADEERLEAEQDEDEAVEPSFFEDPKRLAQTALFVVLIVAGIYFLLPQVAGFEDGLAKLGEGNRVWLAVAFLFGVGMFISYVALFRGVVGERVRLTWGESYEVTMAGLAATRLFSAGGAGGIVLTYWALRKAGMPRRETAARMVAFLVLVYAVYMLTVLINGVLLRVGVFSGPAPAGLTIVPAAVAGGVIAIFLLISLVPGDLERRISGATQKKLWGRLVRRLATLPSTAAVGIREALAFVREPSRGGVAIAGAIGFWAAQIGILWAAFHAFDAEVPMAVVVQGFFVGMFANLIPLPGGVGGVDAGMIGAFLLFDLEVGKGTIFAAVLTYRLIAFWMPLVPGVIAFFQLRRTVQGWEERRRRAPVGSDLAESLPGPITSESKV